MEYKCQYCNKEYSSKSNLNTHIKSAKFCISQREKELIDIQDEIKSYKCEYCETEYTSHAKLKVHYQNCFEYNFKLRSNELKLAYEHSNSVIKQKDLEIERLKESISHYKSYIPEYKSQIFDLKSQLKELQDKLTYMANNAIEKAIDKTSTEYKYEYAPNITSTKSTDTYNTQNFNNLQSINFSPDYIQKVFNENLTLEDVYKGQPGLAEFVHKHFLTDENNKPLAFCTDKSRQILKYKNENDQVVKDPKAYHIASQIAPYAEKAALKLKDEFVEKHYKKSEEKENSSSDEFSENEDQIKHVYIPTNFKTLYIRKKCSKFICDRLGIYYDITKNEPFLEDKKTENEFTSFLSRIINKSINGAKILKKKSRSNRKSPYSPSAHPQNGYYQDSEDESEYETDYEKYIDELEEEDYYAEKELKDKFERLDREKNQEKKQKRAEEILIQIEESEWPQEKKDFYFQRLIKGIQDYQLLTVNLCTFSKRLSMLLPSET